MPPFRAFLVAAAVATMPARTSAQEIQLVKCTCNSAGGVQDLIGEADDLVFGISPLPGGCVWLPPGTYGTIGERFYHVDTPHGRIARISLAQVSGRSGLSAGLVELLS